MAIRIPAARIPAARIPVAQGRGLHRLLAARRRLIAAVLAVAAVALTAQAARPASAAVTVLTAARDLTAGSVLSAGDIGSVRLPAAAAPAGVLRPGVPLVGRRLAGAVRRGETLTDVRLVGRALLTRLGPGVAAVAVTPTDAAVAGLLAPGDRVDVLALADPDELGRPTGGAGPSRTVASGILVVAVLTPARSTDNTLGGALGGGAVTGASSLGSSAPGVLLAVPRAAAGPLVAAAATGPLPVLLTGSTGGVP